ncbi:MAG TPA: GMC family oxidoreductase N-terminal domain-containing protein [Rhodopila sp.]|uniref:GMC family oxidoreductase n=1 Tax=Rhodopila sp. TaxID=2480087 RepID=UPI002CC1BF22|nr:GMC family oxidoreductase N-terminal domain-containing protein [Rhodopila sp.]HVY17526.1 GMC family oxidoreductase N-terminal domain-containing protein [Rhodopila sp.]
MIEADYVVVGAGSAGCVVAARLSETGAKVLLLEAGPKDSLLWIHIPAGILKLLYHPVVNWNYAAAGPEERSIHWPRGKTLGGSSSINGMLYVRGNPADFDGWAQMGCRGWSFEDVLPYFRKSEDYKQGADPEYRGKGGPLKVEDYRTILPLTHHFIQAAQQAGYKLSKDLNGREQEGVGYSQMTRRGRWRGSTAQTFLREARARQNLRVETEALASRLVFDGKRCVGVTFRQHGQEVEARAHKEVVLCGGAINSPHLLQISGVGPAEHLQSIGVPVVHDLRGVGANLQDHYVTRVSHRVRGEISINKLARGLRMAREALRFFTVGNGALTFGVTTAQVFTRSSPEKASPDLQLLFTPASYDPSKFGALEQEDGMTVAVCPVRPDSRGTIMARSADPAEKAVITPNYLSDPADIRVLTAGMRFSRQIFAQPAIARYSAFETLPGKDVESDDGFLDYARKFGTTIYHPVGTCRMGDGPSAVVDSRLRVHGLEGLRVIDASVMPTLTTGNTNAPTIMIGEKGAAMIREDNGLRAEGVAA